MPIAHALRRRAIFGRVIGAIVLAAGLSERLTGPLPKQLLPVGGTTLAGVVVANAESSRFDRIVVVTGHRSSEIRASLRLRRAEVVPNLDYASGNMSSFRVGVDALDGCDAVVVLVADMPGVTTNHMNHFVDVWHNTMPWIAVGSYTDGPGHPLMFSADSLVTAGAMDDPNGLWRFIDAAPPGRVVMVEFPTAKPGDINTIEDYRTFLAGYDPC